MTTTKSTAAHQNLTYSLVWVYDPTTNQHVAEAAEGTYLVGQVSPGQWRVRLLSATTNLHKNLGRGRIRTSDAAMDIAQAHADDARKPTVAETATVVGKCQHCGVTQFNNPNADPALDSMAHLCWKCVQPWDADAAAQQLVWAAAYKAGHAASRRADMGDGPGDMNAGAERARRRHGDRWPFTATDGYVTGWNDQAVGNDYDARKH